MLRRVAPSAMRTADLPGASLDEIGQHAEQPRQRQQKRQRSKHQRQPERNRQKIRFRAARWFAAWTPRPCWDRSPPADRRAHGARAPHRRARRIVSDVLAVFGADRHVHTCARHPDAAEPKARHIPCDADDDEAARDRRRVVRLPRVACRVRLEPQDLSDGVDARPQLARSAFGHDRHRGACAALGLA